MSFTSFNPIQIQQANISKTQPITLKQGQVLHGTIKKLYPDQIAEVQVGGHRLLAKLETPLKAGDSHFLQVTSVSPQAELKVVTGPMDASSTMKQQVNELLDSLKIPKTADMQQVVSHFLKEQVPISKEQLLQVQNLLTGNDNLSKKDAVLALQKMIELKMPLTKEVFLGILHGSKTSGMTDSLNLFAQSLLMDKSISDNTKTEITQTLNRIAKPLDEVKGAVIISRAIQLLVTESEPIGNKLHALNLLKESTILPKQATLSNWTQLLSDQFRHETKPQSLQLANNVIQTMKNMNEGNVSNVLNQVKTWTQNEPNLSQLQKNELMTLTDRFELLPKNSQTIALFTKQMNEILLKAYSSNINNQPFNLNSNGASAIDHLLSLIGRDEMRVESGFLSNIARVVNESSQPQIQNLNQQAELQLKEAFNGNTIQQAIKTVLNSLGINYEAALNQKSPEIEHLAAQLKPQLLSLVNDGTISSSLKEVAEVLLARMNGMQLLSGENGHQQQIIIQIPLQFFGKSMDATLQWNGRMKEDGKIDSNYARVVFYLEMQSLKETVIDMQVQNRIVTISFYNENNHLQPLSEPYQNILKERLSEKGYILSGIFFKTLGKNSTESTVKGSSEKIEGESKYNGVDIRI
ncbi:hypothetical protein [Ureibacillus manganicus]|uniref:Flagellar hook-length control protein-like C-terminal domain-containing protein n=1 Tax=Ureibacillus manganicus DSM 26584 TaxID=1384049 RepID=A0A0A3IZZ6_9BACL|nr:hypothetical protein [Ureibacillus manganicus]KGR80372.1 hypothetical protein CD29_00315 [Ureibacillus manganicus DSM 26584]